MDGTRIDWADSTWNLVTGCLHGCGYCYARKIAQRFGVRDNETLCLQDGRLYELGKHYAIIEHNGQKVYWLYERAYALQADIESGRFEIRACPYPFGFAPTFHRYRLREYANKKRGREIFVCSMADIFGDFIPMDIIRAVFTVCQQSLQHRYLFLTKNIERYRELHPAETWPGTSIPIVWPDNAWAGFSATDQEDLEAVALDSQWLPKQCFVSIEPIHGPVDLSQVEVKGRGAFINLLTGDRSWMFGGDQAGAKLKWVIVGAETGNRVGKVIPEREWIMSIKRQCQKAGVSLWMKESLRELMGEDFSQDKPCWNG